MRNFHVIEMYLFPQNENIMRLVYIASFMIDILLDLTYGEWYSRALLTTPLHSFRSSMSVHISVVDVRAVSALRDKGAQV